jgi:hypothetical protein
MVDLATRLAIGEQLAVCEHEITRAEQRGQDAARSISREAYAELSKLNATLLQAAVDDLFEARRMYGAARDKKRALKAMLGED